MINTEFEFSIRQTIKWPAGEYMGSKLFRHLYKMEKMFQTVDETGFALFSYIFAYICFCFVFCREHLKYLKENVAWQARISRCDATQRFIG